MNSTDFNNKETTIVKIEKFLILLLMTVMIFSSSCIDKKTKTNQCSGIEWKSDLILFGRLKSTDSGLEILSEGKQWYICDSLIPNAQWYLTTENKIEDLPGKYIFAYGKTGQKEKEYFSIDKLLLVTEQAIPDWSKMQKITLMGLINHGKENRPAIETNWESRSKISHHVQGMYEKELVENIGKFVKLICYINEENQNPWSREIVVESIITISNTPVDE